MKITARRMAAVSLAGLAATAAGLASGAPAHAAIANPSLVMTNNQSGATTTYTYTFTPGLNLAQMLTGFNGVLGVPGGATGLSSATVSVFENTGSGWGSALSGVTSTVNSAGNAVGLAVPAADFTGLTSVPQLKVTVANLTNPTVSVSTTAGGCMADALGTISNLAGAVFTTGTSAGTASFAGSLAGGVLNDVACLTSTIVPLGTNGVTEQLNVAPVLNVSLPSTADSFSVVPTASGVALSMPTDNLTVATNALNYTIEGLISGGTSALHYDGSGGYSLPIQATTSTCASAANLGSGGSYSAIASNSGLTNGTVTGITYCGGNVSLTTPSGSYSGTITYLVVPSF